VIGVAFGFVRFHTHTPAKSWQILRRAQAQRAKPKIYWIDHSAVVQAVGAGAATALLYLRKLDKKELESRRDSLSEDFKSPNRTQTTEDYVPPLPDEVHLRATRGRGCL
jgi:hypothetical protein